MTDPRESYRLLCLSLTQYQRERLDSLIEHTFNAGHEQGECGTIRGLALEYYLASLTGEEETDGRSS